jgi:hypothetical protein
VLNKRNSIIVDFPVRMFGILKNSSHHGIALLELALVFPVILLMVCGGIELSRSMTTYSNMNSVIREITGVAFRDCAKLATGAVPTTMDLNEPVLKCLSATLSSSMPSVPPILPGANVILSVFRLDQTAPNNDTAPKAWPPVNSDPNKPGSRLSVGYFNGVGSERYELLRQQVVLVYGEINYDYSPIIPFIAGIFGYGNRSFYVAAAF